MLRKLAVLILSAGLTISPVLVQAMGFGGIKLKSYLNEKLNAEVPLIAASEADISSLSVKLATESAFLRAGVDRTAFLNKLRFKVKQYPDGKYYIHITSTETVREPFVNFLLELDWKNGRMLREYTMLIDPPGQAPKLAEPAPLMAETAPVEPVEETPEEPFAEETASVEEEPVAVEAESPFVESSPMAEEAPATETVEAPVAEEPVEQAAAAEEEVATVDMEPVAEPVEPAPEVEIPPEVTEPEMAEAETQTEEAVFEEESADGELWPRIPLAEYSESTEQAPSEEVAEMGDLDYGIIQKNDKLWDIAEKLRQGDSSVTVYQMMAALLKSNPDAFINGNMNRLKVGHVLRIDDPSVLSSISREEAVRLFNEQTQSWNAYRQQAAEAAGVQPIVAGEETMATEPAVAESGELTLAAPEGESLTAGGGANEETLSNDLATIQEQLRQAKADAGTMRTRNVELNNKLQSLEKELNRLQRSLTVKDDELAALQQQLAELNQKPVVTPQATPEPAPAEPAATAEAPQPEPVTEAQPAEQPAVETQPEAAPEPEKSPVQVAEEIAKKEKATPAPYEPAPEPAKEEGIMDTIMGVLGSIGTTVAGIFAGMNLGMDSLLFIGAPILLVFLIILFIVIKRRRGDNFQESILTGNATAEATDAATAPSGDSTTFSEESSFLSDFAMSGASAIEADDSEVDPLTEADVFMAYGRYEAAEERLNDAIKNDPARGELRAKLLELYHATQNKAAFESAAEDFYAQLGGQEADNPLWARVVSMGAEIAPDNPLFNQSTAAAAVPETSEIPAIDDPGMAMTDSQVMDIGLETGVFDAADLSGSNETAEGDMDFNLDLGDSLEASTSAEEPAADLDFNLDMGTESPAAEAPAEEAPAAEDAGLDFNLDMGTESATEEPAADLDLNLDMGSATEAPADDGMDLSFDMDTASADADSGGLDLNLDIGGEDTSASATDEISLDFDTGGDDAALDLNLDASDTAEADISGGDEVGTKLDLAKAYIDMGDPEGARSILDEVMDEGSSQQKEEAQSLLGQIA